MIFLNNNFNNITAKIINRVSIYIAYFNKLI